MTESVFGDSNEPAIDTAYDDAAYGEEPYGYDQPEEGYYSEPDPANVEGLQALQREFPDIAEPAMLDAITDYLDEIVERTGDESLMTDPRYVRLAYEAVKSTGPEDVMGRIASTQREGTF